jgi:hypothetical protein
LPLLQEISAKSNKTKIRLFLPSKNIFVCKLVESPALSLAYYSEVPNDCFIAEVLLGVSGWGVWLFLQKNWLALLHKDAFEMMLN